MAALQNTPRRSYESDNMWFWGKKSSKWACTPLCYADSIYFSLVRNILNFHWKYFTFFDSPPPLFLIHYYFVNDLIVPFFKKKFFYIRDPIREVFKGKKKNLQWDLLAVMSPDFILACQAEFLV